MLFMRGMKHISMKTKIKEKMNSKIVIVTAILIILFFVLIVFMLIQDVQQKMDNSAILTTQNLLDRLSDNIGSSIEYDKKAIEEYADLIEKNPHDIHDYLENMVTHYQYLEADWIDLDGRCMNQKGESIDIKNLPIEVIQPTDDKQLSDAVEGSFGLWEFVYQIPIDNKGILYVRIPIKRYDTGENMTFYGDEGLAYIFDLESKKIILTPKVPNVMWAYMQDTDAIFEESGFDTQYLEEQIYPALKNKESIVLQGTLKGEKYYISLKDLSNHYDWYLCSVIPASQIQQESSLILQTLFVILIICVGIVCAIFAYVIYEILQRNKKQKEHLQVIEMQNAIYDAMAEASDTFVCIFDRSVGKMELVFQNSQRVLGISDHDLLNNIDLFRSIFDQADHSLYQRLLNGELKSVEEYHCQIVKSDHKQLCDLKVTLKKINVEGQEKYIIFIQDITEDMRMKESLETAVADAQQANGAKSDFLSRMSHEMRTPMNAIIGMCEIAMRSLSSQSKVNDCLAKIKFSSLHLLELINDILDISKIESGKMTLNQERFLLSDCIDEVYGIINVQAQAKHQELLVDISEISNDAFIGDDIRLKQILINLLNNAVKYTYDYGVIKLRVTQEKEYLKERSQLIFTIEDNGIGMSEEFIKKIGSPFEQEHNDLHRSEGGTGLGLAIVKNVVSIMGGIMQVTSELGKGTSISVYLSFEIDQDIDLWSQFKDLSVLLIGNEQSLVNKLTQYFVEAKMDYTIVNDLENGYLKLLESDNTYDVLILDEDLDIDNCIDFLMKIQKKWKDKKSFVLSSHCDSIKQAVIEAGAFALIEKSLLKQSLYQALQSVNENRKKAEYQKFEQSSLQGKHVLIVEDNLLNSEIAKELLEMAGVTVDCAENGLLAKEMYEASKLFTYDLILMDIQMPVMDGYEATKQIHQLQREDANVKIIAMSANAFADDIQKCYDCGMIAHLAKPIDVEKLYQILSENMGEMNNDENKKGD